MSTAQKSAVQCGEDARTALGQGGAAGPINLGPVRVAVVGGVTVTGMSHMARKHRLGALLSSSSSSWPGISPH